MRILYASTKISEKHIAAVLLQEDGSSGYLRNDKSAWLADYSMVDPRLSHIYLIKNPILM